MDLRVVLLSGLLLGSAALGLFAGPAMAQQVVCTGQTLTCGTTVNVEITPPTGPIKPLGPFIALPMKITYTYNPQASVSLTATQINLKVTNAPAWVVNTLSPTTVFIPVSQTEAAGTNTQQAQKSASAFLLVSTTADAPAFTQGTIEVQADAQANGQLLASTFKTQVPVQADFFSLLQASTPISIQKAKPQAQVTYPITVQNFGNAQTKVTFVVDSVPDKWQVTPPPPLTLLSKQQGGTQNSQTANVVIQTPFSNGYLNVVGAITIRITSAYALDPKIVGDSTIVSTLTTTKGFYVPGFEPAFALMAMGALALGLRRLGR